MKNDGISRKINGLLQYWGGVLKKKFVKFVVQDLTSGGVDWQREKWQSGFGSKFIRQGEKNAVKYADEIQALAISLFPEVDKVADYLRKMA